MSLVVAIIIVLIVLSLLAGPKRALSVLYELLWAIVFLAVVFALLWGGVWLIKSLFGNDEAVWIVSWIVIIILLLPKGGN